MGQGNDLGLQLQGEDSSEGGPEDAGLSYHIPYIPSSCSGRASVSPEKQLKVSLPARLKPRSLLRKEDQDRRGGPGGSHTTAEGGAGASEEAGLPRGHRPKICR